MVFRIPKKLTGNEKKAVICLVENARMPDTRIAEKLKISTQAAGKIRKRLESEIITGYTARIDYERIGITMFAVALIKAKPCLWQKGNGHLREKLGKIPGMIYMCRIAGSDICAIAIFGFRDMPSMETFFHSLQKNEVIEIAGLFPFCAGSIIKDSNAGLVKNALKEGIYKLNLEDWFKN